VTVRLLRFPVLLLLVISAAGYLVQVANLALTRERVA
jgi:hypothetical protein